MNGYSFIILMFFSDALLDERPHKKRVVLSRFPQASENNTFYQLRFFNFDPVSIRFSRACLSP